MKKHTYYLHIQAHTNVKNDKCNKIKQYFFVSQYNISLARNFRQLKVLDNYNYESRTDVYELSYSPEIVIRFYMTTDVIHNCQYKGCFNKSNLYSDVFFLNIRDLFSPCYNFFLLSCCQKSEILFVAMLVINDNSFKKFI